MAKRRRDVVELSTKKACYGLRSWVDFFVVFQTSIVDFLDYHWTDDDVLDRFQIGKTCKSLRSLMLRARPIIWNWISAYSVIRSRYFFLRTLASLKWGSFLKPLFIDYRPCAETTDWDKMFNTLIFACCFRSQVYCTIQLKIKVLDEDTITIDLKLHEPPFKQISGSESEKFIEDLFRNPTKLSMWYPNVCHTFDLNLSNIPRNYIRSLIGRHIAICLSDDVARWVEDYEWEFGEETPWDQRYDEKHLPRYQKQIFDELGQWTLDEFQEPCVTLDQWKKQIYSRYPTASE